MDKNFGGVIWTNHALERLRQRGISQSDAWAAWRNPDQSRYATSRGAWVYYKTWGTEKIEVVAKKNERGAWIILSVWSRPIDQGAHPHSKKGTSLGVRLLKKLLNIK